NESADGIAVRGEAHYLNGEYDVENDRLEPNPDGVPHLTNFMHEFYNADRTPQLLAQADFKSGTAECRRYRKGGAAESASISQSFPDDTDAGVALIVPIAYGLREGDREVKFHAFSCVRNPKVLAVKARVDAGETQWQFHPGKLARIDVRPDMGWMNVFAAPFLPTISAWFNPHDEWDYVG